MRARVSFLVGIGLECRVAKPHIIVEEVSTTAREVWVLPVPTGEGISIAAEAAGTERVAREVPPLPEVKDGSNAQQFKGNNHLINRESNHLPDAKGHLGLMLEA